MNFKPMIFVLCCISMIALVDAFTPSINDVISSTIAKRTLGFPISEYSCQHNLNKPMVLSMSGSSDPDFKRSEAERLMREAKAAAEAAEEAARKAAQLKETLKSSSPRLQNEILSSIDSSLNTEVYGVRADAQLLRDKSLESKFDLEPPPLKTRRDPDEDALFGLSGDVMRTVKSVTWAGILCLLLAEGWALTQPTSPLMSPGPSPTTMSRAPPAGSSDSGLQ
jgi:hypothetical protein